MNVKWSKSQITKLRSGARKATKATLNLLLNLIFNCNDEVAFSETLLSTKSKVSNLGKPFANALWANINLSKTHLYNIGLPGGFTGRLF